jgi:crotonobetainyl-CoA:carnitine CoA-transferase CaiB-like acyl-CoA transferase
LNRELNAALASRTAAEWERVLSAAGVPAARILTVPEALELDQLTHRDFFTDVPFPGPPRADGRSVRLSGSGVVVDGHPRHATRPAPLLGEHNHELAQISRRWAEARAATVEAAHRDEAESRTPATTSEAGR